TLRGATGLYLVSPILRIDFAGLVGRFLDQAERAGVRHVTYLSAYGMEHAPAEVAPRAVELDLAARCSLTSTMIRPAWFMEDFSETFLQPVNDEIVVPAGDGAEAFVSVEDIAAVAAVTLTEPETHAGHAYAPTGPQALTMAEAAAMISAAAGRTITYRDADREQWIAAMVSTGIPAEYAAVLRPLTATVASGHGARPNSDVLEVTRTAPVTFAEFAARTAPAWK
ncbi:MAG TPA: NmrA family NAD(P)-binding protein, partial [Streptosporangiaceae bacterium]|nr:NmrA family NAD(P)-binding protein [Streptosporangiaceae bacterium]